VQYFEKGTMGIRTIIAIGLGLIAVSAQAAPTTNSWVYTGANVNNYHWDVDNSWSLGAAPSSSDYADYITNAVTKTVVINANDTSFAPSTLTISNLTVAGLGSTTNTLSLTNMNAGVPIPLTILNGLTIGNGGRLEIDNSMLQASNATFTSGSILLFALGTNSSPVVVSNNLVLAGTLDVADGGGLTTSNYTLFTYGGTLSYSGLVIGSTPSNATCVVSTNIIGQVNLAVTLTPPVSPLPFQIIAIARNTNDITVMWTTSASGTNFVQAGNGDANGSYDTNNFQDIYGPVIVSVGTTNSYTDVGGATNTPSRFYRILYSH
jgi:hypothetical protein